MTNKRKLKNNQCPTCEQGYLITQYVTRSNEDGYYTDELDFLSCSVCNAGFDKWTRERVIPPTHAGMITALGMSIDNLVDAIWQPLDKPFNDLMEMVINFVESVNKE